MKSGIPNTDSDTEENSQSQSNVDYEQCTIES